MSVPSCYKTVSGLLQTVSGGALIWQARAPCPVVRAVVLMVAEESAASFG